MGKLMKTKRVLAGNLFYMFGVLMSQYDADIKNQVESMNNIPDLEKKLDSMVLLNTIKKPV